MSTGYIEKFELLAAACRDPHLNRGQLAVLAVIVARYNAKSGNCWPGVTLISAEAKLDRRNVIRALQVLEQRRWVLVERSLGKSNVYRLNPLTGDAVATSDELATRGNPATRDAVATSDELATAPVANTPLELVANSPPESLNRTSKGISKEKKRVSEMPLTLPDWLSPELWEVWCKYRKAKSGKGFTRLAEELSLKKLVALRAQGFEPKEVIENAIEMTWSGLFPPTGKRKPEPRSGFATKNYAVPDYLAGAV